MNAADPSKDPAVGLPTGTIRNVVPADTDALVALAVATGLFLPGEADLLLRQTLDDMHEGRLGAGHFACALYGATGGAPEGWVYFSLNPKADGIWDLWWIGVDPARQGTGVGSRLLSYVEAHVQEQGGRVLIIETSSQPPLAATRAFYRRRGYRECGCVPDFYAPGDGKITFAKTVSPHSPPAMGL